MCVGFAAEIGSELVRHGDFKAAVKDAFLGGIRRHCRLIAWTISRKTIPGKVGAGIFTFSDVAYSSSRVIILLWIAFSFGNNMAKPVQMRAVKNNFSKEDEELLYKVINLEPRQDQALMTRGGSEELPKTGKELPKMGKELLKMGEEEISLVQSVIKKAEQPPNKLTFSEVRFKVTERFHKIFNFIYKHREPVKALYKGSQNELKRDIANNPSSFALEEVRSFTPSTIIKHSSTSDNVEVNAVLKSKKSERNESNSLSNAEQCGKIEIVYRIKEDRGLVRAAEEACENTEVQTDINRLEEKLAKGNDNPGIGRRTICKGVIEHRGDNGGRLYVRKRKSGVIEILAKSGKKKTNQNFVIKRLKEIYG